MRLVTPTLSQRILDALDSVDDYWRQIIVQGGHEPESTYDEMRLAAIEGVLEKSA